MICVTWYFLNYSFKFQPNVCNRCHDLLMMSMNFSNIAIVNIEGSDYRCTISLTPDKFTFGEKNYKYFDGYLDNDDKVKPLNIMLPKTSDDVKSYEGQTKWTYFLIEDDGLFKKYYTIWDKFSSHIKKNLIVCLSKINNSKKLKNNISS